MNVYRNGCYIKWILLFKRLTIAGQIETFVAEAKVMSKPADHTSYPTISISAKLTNQKKMHGYYKKRQHHIQLQLMGKHGKVVVTNNILLTTKMPC